MKPSILLALGVVALVAGCTHTVPPLEDRAEENAALVNRVLDDAIRNAILRQHTLFDYHFVRNAATLNELGRHDLDLLAAHYKQHPGPLNVCQEGAPTDLYEARVGEVKRLLIEAGVAEKRIQVEDGLPGGDGAPVQHVIQIAAPWSATKPPKASSTPSRR